MTKFIKVLYLLALSPLLIGCNRGNNTPTVKEDFGVFLGADDSSINKLYNYKKVAIELEEFSNANIKSLKDQNIEIYAYLSIGSLESYRSYYDEFKDITFMDYDNWKDERWIDTSNKTWQNLMSTLATDLKDKGADGLFLDNFDVYYIASEEYECSEEFQEGIYDGCRTILDNLSKLDLRLLINSGTDFLERMNEENDPLIKEIDVFAQECVFSKIDDYEKDIFSTQDKETHDYYLSIISFMKKDSDILLIEYTKDNQLIKEIDTYCQNNNFYYYVSSSVKLI